GKKRQGICTQKIFDNPKIDVLWDSVIVGYYGEGFIEGVKIENVKTGEITERPVGGVFMAIGHDPNTKWLKDIDINGKKVELDEKGYVKVKNLIHTNLEGIFAAGDVHDTAYRQAVSAAGFGCMAAIAAARWIEDKGL
ncbi:MAG: NAD(P)/FAD-dependent oxidoreductase, partial [Candidatus Odinarchaeota archaeon]